MTGKTIILKHNDSLLSPNKIDQGHSVSEWVLKFLISKKFAPIMGSNMFNGFLGLSLTNESPILFIKYPVKNA